jgi:hypothetical protein
MEKRRPLFIFLHLPKTGGTTLNVHLAKNLKFDEEYVHIGNWGNEYRKNNGLEDWFKRPQKEKNKAKFIAGHGVYYGIHKHVRNVDAYYISIIRDPMKRFLSGYHFEMSEMVGRGNEALDILSYYDQLGADPSGLGHLRLRNMTNKFIWRMNRSNFLNRINKSKTLTSSLRKVNHFFMFHTPLSISKTFDDIKHYFQYKRAKDLVDKCWLVCDTEELDQYLPILFNKLGVVETFGKFRVNDSERNIDDPKLLLDERKLRKFAINDSEMKIFQRRFLQENLYDYKLYEFARNRINIFENNLKNYDE